MHRQPLHTTRSIEEAFRDCILWNAMDGLGTGHTYLFLEAHEVHAQSDVSAEKQASPVFAARSDVESERITFNITEIMSRQLLILLLLAPLAISDWSDCTYTAPNGDVYDLSALKVPTNRTWGPGYVSGDRPQSQMWYYTLCQPLSPTPEGCPNNATFCRKYGDRGQLNQTEAILFNDASIVQFTEPEDVNARVSVVQNLPSEPAGGPHSVHIDIFCSEQPLVEIIRRSSSVKYQWDISWYTPLICSQPARSVNTTTSSSAGRNILAYGIVFGLLSLTL
ncbi:hypothetical protein PROFUN_12763 [Planoprotostelium fungivorum]|uniref:Autophagy-related protein 27 n=1 Tax=Planoprotostelium fungivorum TaxID=1890364 RepID=A0A2P6N5J0_9EUKA|nr:hypothetical protein PROFUN_12763 [Planoprotostelium fungivorum]